MTTTSLSLATGAIHVDLFQAVRDADLMGWLSLAGCLALSIASWAVIFAKWRQVSTAENANADFLAEIEQAGGSLEDAYANATHHPDSPLAKILREACLEMEGEDWYRDPSWNQDDRLTAARLGLERVMERTISTEMDDLQSRLILLATTSSVAPFVGLFGTVWGVLAAFQALGKMQGAALQALAPGMATALVATLAGLMAAIPASLFYNYFTHRIDALASHMDSFALELANIFQKRLLKSGPGQ